MTAIERQMSNWTRFGIALQTNFLVACGLPLIWDRTLAEQVSTFALTWFAYRLARSHGVPAWDDKLGDASDIAAFVWLALCLSQS